MRYINLFKPITFANQEIKNRIFMAPMGTGFEEQYGEGKVSTEMIDFYEARAKGGVAMIISPFAAVDERYFALTLGVYSRRLLQGISRLSEVLNVYGCKFLVQLSHFGGKSPRYFTHGNVPIAPSKIESRMYPEIPEEMTLEQIEEIIGLYIQSGEWTRDSGCAGVELHGAHGYLINQFISPHSNRRDDEYGGTLEKRMNFLAKIAKGIREKCGDDFIIGFKFSAYEALEGGINTKIAKEVAQFIEKQGVIDYIHVSAFSTTLPGFLDSDFPSVPPIYIKPPLVKIAAEIKKVVNIPIIAAAGIGDPDYAESIIASRKADAVMLGRALLADPEWANKARDGYDIKICIKCNVCYKKVLNQQQIKCSINPYLGEEQRYRCFRENKAAVSKKVVIIGAGPAGMEAALIAYNRGHKVTLIEKEKYIGGKLKLAAVPDFKKEVKQLLSYYERKIKKSNIDLRLSINATPKYITGQKPDVVILAVGSSPVVPDILGIDKNNVFPSVDIFTSKKVKLGSNIVIIGAGLVGCETGLYLALKGHKVNIIECLEFDEILSDESPGNKHMLVRKLREEGAKITCGTDVIEIFDDGVLVKNKSGNKEKIISDNVLFSVGFKLKDKEYLGLKNGLISIEQNLCIYSIGDCTEDGKIYEAINSAAHIAWQL